MREKLPLDIEKNDGPSTPTAANCMRRTIAFLTRALPRTNNRGTQPANSSATTTIPAGLWKQNASLILLSDSPYAGSVKLDDENIVFMCKAMRGFFVNQPLDVVVDFVIRTLLRRLDCFTDTQSVTTSIPDLSDLSRTAYTWVMSTVVEAIDRAPRP